MGKLFTEYGIKAAGAPPFLKRTSTATTVTTWQRRTLSGYTYSSCSWSCNYGSKYTSSKTRTQCRNTSVTCKSGASKNTYSWSNTTSKCYYYRCRARISTKCSWNYSGWSNVSSCTASVPGCSNGASGVECQSSQSVQWGAWSAWEEADECTAVVPALVDGAIQVECMAN